MLLMTESLTSEERENPVDPSEGVPKEENHVTRAVKNSCLPNKLYGAIPLTPGTNSGVNRVLAGDCVVFQMWPNPDSLQSIRFQITPIGMLRNIGVIVMLGS